MVKIVARHFLSSLALVLLIALVAAAQAPATGRLTGTVTDPSSAVVPGAEIVAKNAQTGSEFRAVTNAVGVWVVPSVPSGRYTVIVSAQGFRTLTFHDIKVAQGGTVKVDAPLQIGLQNEVVVTASKFEEDVVNAPATATVISEQTIRDSPTQNVAELLRAVPGMNVAQTSARAFSVNGRAATGISPGTQLVLIDGRTIYLDYIGWVAWDFVPTSLDEVKQVKSYAVRRRQCGARTP